MKKTPLVCMCVMILVFTACKKQSPSYGSITFQSVSYNVNTCLASNGPNTLSGWNSTQNFRLNVTFDTTLSPGSGTNLPTQSAIDTVIKYVVQPSSLHQVSISFNTGTGGNYVSTGGNGANQTINVSVSNGKVALSATNIEMVSQSNPSDSTPISFNISEE